METMHHRNLGVFAIAILIAVPLFAYELALIDGRIVRFQKYRVAGDTLYYVGHDGKEVSLPIASIDLDRTRRLNASERPPLELPGIAAPAPPSNPGREPSLGEVARKLRRKEATGPKRVYTTDDFQLSSPAVQPGTAAAPQDQAVLMERVRSVLHSMQRQTEQQAVQDALGTDLAEITFPERPRWEASFLAARRRYLSLLEQCLSNRRSEFEESRAACSRVSSAQYEVEALSREGRKLAADWKAR